jgi:hypothetical protein
MLPAPLARIIMEMASMFYSLRQLQKEGIAPSESAVRRYIKEGKISPPFQMGRGAKRRFDDNHRAEFLGLQKPKAATA